MLRADVSTQEQEYVKDRCVISRKEKNSASLELSLAIHRWRHYHIFKRQLQPNPSPELNETNSGSLRQCQGFIWEQPGVPKKN